MTKEDLIRHITLGSLPVLVWCEKKYEGICCMLKITTGNTVFLDYDQICDDCDSEGGFRATFRYASPERMIAAIEHFTGKNLRDLTCNPQCSELFVCKEPQWQAFQWALYRGEIPMLKDAESAFIGDFFWDGLYQRKFTPDVSTEQLLDWMNERQDAAFADSAPCG